MYELIESHEGRLLGTRAALEELCGRISVTNLLDLLINSAAQRPVHVAECARRSYRHPLGFEKIMLMVGPRSSTLRMHVWRPTDAPMHAVGHVHNHRFEFASLVVLGSVLMETFVRHRSGEPMTAFAETVGTDGQSWVMRPCGEERLRKAIDLRLEAGMMYQMDSEALHRVTRNSSRCTVTLFLEAASGPCGKRTDVYSALGASAPAEFHRAPLVVDEYVTALAGIRSLIHLDPQDRP